jgi:hypothetical protein
MEPQKQSEDISIFERNEKKIQYAGNSGILPLEAHLKKRRFAYLEHRHSLAVYECLLFSFSSMS